MADKEITMLEQLRDTMMDCLSVAMPTPRRRRIFGASSWQLRGLLGQPLPQSSQDAQHRLSQLLEDMELTNLMGNRPKYPGNWLWVQWRGIGRDAQDHAAVGRDQSLQATKKPGDVPVSRVVLQHVVEQPALPSGIDGRQDTEGAIVKLISRQVAREIGQGPIQIVGLSLRLAFFFPQPRPSSGSWRRERRRGDHARGATKRCDRAGRLPPPVGRPR